MAEKDLEMLDDVASTTRTDSLPERIARLKRELDRGEAVYNGEELRRLQHKLEESEILLEAIQRA